MPNCTIPDAKDEFELYYYEVLINKFRSILINLTGLFELAKGAALAHSETIQPSLVPIHRTD